MAHDARTFVTVAEAAIILGVHASNVYDLIASRRLRKLRASAHRDQPDRRIVITRIGRS